MRICVLADGESIHTIRWCNQFKEYGHEIHLISFKNAHIEGINCHFLDIGKIEVAGGNWKVLLCGGKIKKLLAEIKPDVLHALYATSYGIAGALSGFHPFIVTPLGTDVLISPKNSFVYRVLLRYVFKKADKITSLAPHMTEAIKNLGGSSNKIEEVIFGINTDIFNNKNRKVDNNVFSIASIRNLEPVYNISLLLKAVSLVKGKIPNMTLTLIGDGSLRKRLEEEAKTLGISSFTKFIGKVSQKEVVSLLQSSKVVVTVSLSDGNALSLLESMACGAYPIASDIPANKQWIEDGVNGTLVPVDNPQYLADKLLEIYSSYDSIINDTTERSQKIITEKGTWQVNMKKMNGIYIELIK
ncbi:MAG: glycosyltransferase [Bacteroidia bacterium]